MTGPSKRFLYNISETRLGVDRVKPWSSVRINLGLGWRGPDFKPWLDIIEGLTSHIRA